MGFQIIDRPSISIAMRIMVVGLFMFATIAAFLANAQGGVDSAPELASAPGMPITTKPSLVSPERRSLVVNMPIRQLSVLPTNQAESALKKQGFIVNHQSVALFEAIPDNYISAGQELGVLFSDRSVGQNINEALNCLAAMSWASSPAYCRRDYYDTNWNWKTYKASDQSSGLVPSRIRFDPNPDKYNRSNWTFVYKEGSWTDLTQDFIQVLAPAYIDSKDVLSYQFGYLNADATSDIADPNTGFFADNTDTFDIYDLESYIAKHPDKVFIFWTISLARGIGSQAATDFNNQMRQYALEHDKILFDMADIVSHTDQGVACYDNRDGIQYCTPKGKCENYPNDGKNMPAICQDYTTETDGGHLGSVSGAKIRVAKAFWVMMAGIAGWDGVQTETTTDATSGE